MRHLRSRLLVETPLVRVADVTCSAPRGGPAGDEGGGERVELVLPRRGVFSVHHGSEQTVADPNSVVVLGAGAEHRVSHPAHGGDVCTALRFAPAISEEALGASPARHALVTPATQLATSALTAALARGRAEPLEAEEAALALLCKLAPGLAGSPPPQPRAAAALRRAQEVRGLLAAEPAVNWHLDDIARALHCSPFHLARQFRAATGETIARYLQRLRLAAALERIAAGEPSLARLAVELGFSNHSHLSARFRAAFGVTPSEARKIVTAGGAAPA